MAFRHDAHHRPDEGLWDVRVHSVHAHMVAVVGTPAERYFREVASADDGSAHLVSQVHQHLSAFAGLRVFVGDVVVRRVLADVLEMLEDGIADPDFHRGDAQPVHQLPGVGVRPVRSAEAGHGDGIDALAVISQAVECFAYYQQGEGAVQAAGHADHALAAVDMLQPAHQRGSLDVENLAAALFEQGGIRGHERMRVQSVHGLRL